MRTFLILFSLLTLFSGLTLGQAVVIKGESDFAYGMPDFDKNLSAFGGTDWDRIHAAMNYFAGCEFDVETPFEGTITTLDVITPSGNWLFQAHGPMIHAVWDDNMGSPCDTEPLIWGWGSYSISWPWHHKKGLSLRFTANATLPVSSDFCESELAHFTGTWQSNGKGGRGYSDLIQAKSKINLSCSED